ncbi:hypothetical protein LTR28_006043, partial [Elasticomyces elasticus]
LLLQLHRTKPAGQANLRIRFHGREVDVPLPAGVTATSGWFDITRSMPSLQTNARYDYLPPPTPGNEVQKIAHDDIWPTVPPRGDTFCDLSMLCHPLVSPLAVKSWEGAPPLWLNSGEEMLSDEHTIVAARAAQQGVRVTWEQYEAMPHVFQMLLDRLEGSKRCMRSWGEFCRKCVERPEELSTNGKWIEAKTLKETTVDVTKLASLGYEDAVKKMHEAKRRRVEGWEKEAKALPIPNV